MVSDNLFSALGLMPELKLELDTFREDEDDCETKFPDEPGKDDDSPPPAFDDFDIDEASTVTMTLGKSDARVIRSITRLTSARTSLLWIESLWMPRMHSSSELLFHRANE